MTSARSALEFGSLCGAVGARRDRPRRVWDMGATSTAFPYTGTMLRESDSADNKQPKQAQQRKQDSNFFDWFSHSVVLFYVVQSKDNLSHL